MEDFGKEYHRGSVNLIHMRCTCDIHVVCMWYPWGVRVISRWCACDIQVTEQWAIPLKIHTPPVEDFGKVYHQGSVNLIPMRCTCDTHVVCMWYPCGVHVISRWLSNGLLHLKSIHPLWNFASLNHKAFDNLFCNSQKSFHTSLGPYDLNIHPLWKLLEKCTSGGVLIFKYTFILCVFRSGLSQRE